MNKYYKILTSTLFFLTPVCYHSSCYADNSTIVAKIETIAVSGAGITPFKIDTIENQFLVYYKTPQLIDYAKLQLNNESVTDETTLHHLCYKNNICAFEIQNQLAKATNSLNVTASINIFYKEQKEPVELPISQPDFTMEIITTADKAINLRLTNSKKDTIYLEGISVEDNRQQVDVDVMNKLPAEIIPGGYLDLVLSFPVFEQVLTESKEKMINTNFIIKYEVAGNQRQSRITIKAEHIIPIIAETPPTITQDQNPDKVKNPIDGATGTDAVANVAGVTSLVTVVSSIYVAYLHNAKVQKQLLNEHAKLTTEMTRIKQEKNKALNDGQISSEQQKKSAEQIEQLKKQIKKNEENALKAKNQFIDQYRKTIDELHASIKEIKAECTEYENIIEALKKLATKAQQEALAEVEIYKQQECKISEEAIQSDLRTQNALGLYQAKLIAIKENIEKINALQCPKSTNGATKNSPGNFLFKEEGIQKPDFISELGNSIDQFIKEQKDILDKSINELNNTIEQQKANFNNEQELLQKYLDAAIKEKERMRQELEKDIASTKTSMLQQNTEQQTIEKQLLQQIDKQKIEVLQTNEDNQKLHKTIEQLQQEITQKTELNTICNTQLIQLKQQLEVRQEQNKKEVEQQLIIDQVQQELKQLTNEKQIADQQLVKLEEQLDAVQQKQIETEQQAITELKQLKQQLDAAKQAKVETTQQTTGLLNKQQQLVQLMQNKNELLQSENALVKFTQKLKIPTNDFEHRLQLTKQQLTTAQTQKELNQVDIVKQKASILVQLKQKLRFTQEVEGKDIVQSQLNKQQLINTQVQQELKQVTNEKQIADQQLVKLEEQLDIVQQKQIETEQQTTTELKQLKQQLDAAEQAKLKTTQQTNDLLTKQQQKDVLGAKERLLQKQLTQFKDDQFNINEQQQIEIKTGIIDQLKQKFQFMQGAKNKVKDFDHQLQLTKERLTTAQVQQELKQVTDENQIAEQRATAELEQLKQRLEEQKIQLQQKLDLTTMIADELDSDNTTPKQPTEQQLEIARLQQEIDTYKKQLAQHKEITTMISEMINEDSARTMPTRINMQPFVMQQESFFSPVAKQEQIMQFKTPQNLNLYSQPQNFGSPNFNLPPLQNFNPPSPSRQPGQPDNSKGTQTEPDKLQSVPNQSKHDDKTEQAQNNSGFSSQPESQIKSFANLEDVMQKLKFTANGKK